MKEGLTEEQKDWQSAAKRKSASAAARLGQLAVENKITHQAIAQITGMQQPSISRLFGGRFAPRLDLIIAILNAINDLSGQSFTLKNIDYAEPSNEPETGQL